MNTKEQLPQLNISLDKTEAILDENGNPRVMAEGLIFRKANRFLTGTKVDSLIPIPVMYDTKSGKILIDMIPAEIRNEYKEVGFSLVNEN